jgi:hypothetical protein
MTGKWDLEPEMAPTRQPCIAHPEIVRAQQEQARLLEEYHQEDLQAVHELGDELKEIKTQVSEINGALRVLLAQQAGVHIQGPQSSGQTVTLQTTQERQSQVQWPQILGVLIGALAVLGALVPGAAHGAIEVLRGLMK